MSTYTKVTFRFMDRRTSEDEDMPVGSICVDWGDRNDGPYFDHHVLTARTCSTSLVNSVEGIARLKEQVAVGKAFAARRQIITHASPDLDSVGAACTVARVMRGNASPLHDILVDYILAKDQGHEVGENPSRSIALLFQAIKDECHGDDQSVMTQGVALLEAVDQAIRQRSFRPGWNDPCDIPALGDTACRLQAVLERNGDALRRIISQSPRALLSIPTATEGGSRRFSWIDGIVLDFSALDGEPLGWKEFVRHDVRSSMNGHGYAFTAVVARKRERNNYILSVDPGSGLSLEGLGATLDAHEQRESLRLDAQTDSWPPRLNTIAGNRNPEKTPASLIRDTASPRDGYDNADPWYDGRGHGFTIVDTPESGSVLEATDILKATLSLYDPLWAETLIQSKATLFECSAAMEIRQATAPEWLRTASADWRTDTADKNRQPITPGTTANWADILQSLACRQPDAPHFAVYLPLRPHPSQLLPEGDRTLYLQLALYLAMHGQAANTPDYPQLETFKQWATEFVWRPLPGVWCAVSERGAIMADYARGADAIPCDFVVFRDDYFALIRQLGWTQTLSRSVCDMKRFEALRDFAKRNAAG